MNATDGLGCYTTERPIGPFAPGTQVRFYCAAENGNGSVSHSDTLLCSIPTLPDLRVTSARFSGTDRVKIEAVVVNQGGGDVASTSVHFICPQLDFIGEDTSSVASYEEAVVSVPISPTMEALLL